MKALILAFSFISLSAFAHEGPPPEALAACKDKAKDAGCSFTSPHGDSVTGTCFTPASSKPLACKPAGHEGGGQHHGSGEHHGSGAHHDSSNGNASGETSSHGSEQTHH